VDKTSFDTQFNQAYTSSHGSSKIIFCVVHVQKSLQKTGFNLSTEMVDNLVKNKS
tara:strand:+ start:23942 stop:24106 length:165 start_codon:yes stop_codon:yes gene_type:complete